MFFEIAGAVLVGNLLTLVIYKIVEANPQIVGTTIIPLLWVGLVGVGIYFLVMGFQNPNYWFAFVVFELIGGGTLWLTKKIKGRSIKT